MSLSVNKNNYGDGSNALVVLNPIHHGIGDFVDEIATLTQVYDGKTIRVSNAEYIDDPSQAVGEYDEAFIIDENGLDRVDTRALSQEADIFDFAGGPLEDIASVYHDLDRQDFHGYNLMDRVSYDYGAVASDGTVLTDEMQRVSDLLEWDEDAAEDRFHRQSIDELLDTLS